eukprot:Phypoly_transcript_00130.p1 GENE.Phypoly_transcript_00130~~Phypoly_transcript_00130.p1  ORF type:complete len:1598 (-),score=297.06 Phypoly_transcript_00130:1790-6358(-)
MGKFEINIPEIQAEIKAKFGTPSGFIQKWFPLESRGIKEDGEIKGDLLLKLEIISGNEEQKSSVLFYKWFPEIPHTDTVIKEWLCVREGKLGVPTTGHLHLTQNYVCFNPSNKIVTKNTVVIPLKEITDLSKRLSNLMLPTSIEISSTRKKYWFSGFVHRNTVYRMIEAQWKNGNAITLINEIDESDLSATSGQSSEGSLHSDVDYEDATTHLSPPAPAPSHGSTTPPPQRSGASITLHVQPENTPELNLPDTVPLKIFTPASVRDLFAAIHEKSAQDFVVNDLISSFELAIPKKKKGFELSINPINVALNVGHTVTSMVQSGFASRRKVKLVLDESKPLTFYNIKDGDTLILRKKVTTKALNLKVEIPDKKDLVAATYDSSTQIKVILDELGKKFNTEFVPGKYHIMLSKQGSRGIIMEPEGILGNYLVTDQDILRIKKSCPVSTITDIYEALSGEYNQNAALYECASHCLFAPVSPKKIDPSEAKALLKKIKDRLDVPDNFCAEVAKRLELQKPYITEVNLVELFHRLAIENSHPFYAPSSFESTKKFEEWIESEKAAVTKIVNNLIFKPEVFFGMLTVTVLEATDVVAVDYIGGKSDPYCILEVDGEKKHTRTRKRTLNPVWNDTFIFGVQNVDAKLQITVMDQNKVEQDNFLAKLDIPLRNISNGVPVMGWFNLPTKGKIRLHMQFSHQFSKYIHMLNQGPPAPPAGSEKLNCHELFKQLLQILIEFDNGIIDFYHGEKELLTDNSKKLLEEFANRFGVGSVSRLVLDLEVLSKYFKPNEQYIDWMEEVLNDLDKLQDQENFSLTKTEHGIVTKAATALLDKLLQTVEQFKQLFPQNEPAGALTNIVECVGILKQLKKSDEKPSELLLPAAKTSVQNRFDSLIREVVDKHPGPWGPPELTDLVEKIKVEHQEDLFYESVFPREIDVVQEASLLYLAGLQEKVAFYCARADYSQAAIDLFFKIRDLEKMLDVKREPGKRRKLRASSNPVKPEAATSPTERTHSRNNSTSETDPFAPDPFEAAFKPIFFGYLKDVDAKLRSWCEKACELDKGEPVSIGIKQSSSVIDVFSSLRQAFSEMEKLQVKDTFFKVQFLEIINEVVRHYSKLQCQLISKLIDQNKTGTLVFTPQMCVYLNNIQAARNQLDELVNTVGPSAPQVSPTASPDKHLSVHYEALQTSHELCVQNAFAQLKTTLLESQDLFVKVMRERIADITMSQLLGMKEGSRRLSKPPPPPADYTPKPFADNVTQYLEAQLEVLSENLEDKVFSSVMKRLWEALVEDLVELVLPHKDVSYTLSPQQITLVGEYVNILRDYFHANGSGVALPHLETSSAVIKSAVSLYTKDTQILLDIYGQLSEKPNHPQYPGVQVMHVVKILATRAPADKEAKIIVRNYYAKKDDKFKEEDKKIRDLLLLPASETIIDKYVCTHDGKTGQMILTSNYLCFDPILGGGPDSEHQIALKFTELSAIKKKRVMLVFAAIEVTTEDNKTYLFSSFVDRDGCLADIRLQITKKGNTKVVVEQ